jgi:U3 small nucleolar RNA-associated protein 13
VLWFNKGLQLASAGSEGSLNIWNIKKGVSVASYSVHLDKIWAIDIKDDQIITGGADSLITVWRDNTEESKEADLEEKQNKMQNEQELSNFIFSEQWKEAAIKAFEMQKSRDLAFILNQVRKEERDLTTKDPID